MKSTKLPLNPKVEIWRWGPLPAKFYFLSDFVEAIYGVYPKVYKGYAWPKMLGLFTDTSSLWLGDKPDLVKAGAKVFEKYIFPNATRKKIRKNWDLSVKKLEKFEQGFININLKLLSDDELYLLGKEFYGLLMDFWVPTVPVELGNYGSEFLLDRNLRNYVPANKVHGVMEILTAPEELSFYQQEEIALSESKDISLHQERFFWLQNSYNGIRVLPVAFFSSRKKQLPKNIKSVFQKHLNEAKAAKKKTKKQYQLPVEIMNIAQALSYGVAWQDERKKQIFIYLHHKDRLLKEIARRKKYAYKDMVNLSTVEILDSLKHDYSKILTKRQKPFGFECTAKSIKELSSKDVIKYWNLYTLDRSAKTQSMINGISVSMGKNKVVRGQVRIVLDPFKEKDFKKGDILVAPMTSPEYIFIMKLSAAIITDTGGLTSHAAIVSRELAVPCIVGTKIATQVFKNGDWVEVDAGKGIVSRINK